MATLSAQGLQVGMPTISKAWRVVTAYIVIGVLAIGVAVPAAIATAGSIAL